MDNPSAQGKFINFCLDYSKLSSQQQAEKILKKADELVGNASKGVAITYSANYGQTRKIQQVYLAGGWHTQTNGSNQAQVMHAMESLLADTYQHLQGKLRIVPITTMNAYENPVEPWNNGVHMGIVITDLDRIWAYLENGWSILGWQHQKTVNSTTHPYAVGGGIANVPESISQNIQKTLMGYANTMHS